MADQERQPSHAEQRMLAVAKLKRAASLPRMKDGRRPPMHVEAVSEGEKGTSDVEKAASGSEKAVSEEEKNQTDDEKKVAADSPQPEESHIESAEADAEDAEGDVEERTVSPRPASRNKRRTRSRSRSRGSKDMKGKNRAMQSPIPPVIIAGDSSQDEAPPPPRIIALPVIPPLLSPIPSSFALMSNSRLLRSPTPLSPEPSLFYPGTSPPTPIPLPTLEALQRGLMRSNSAGSTAAGRRMAMHKLTGGTETYDPSPSPTPPPHIGKLGRNNTVSGGERTAARQNMLSRLGGRITKEADAEQASGAEEVQAPFPNPKRKRRRSRRSSTTAPPVVSDSDFISTSPSTPIVPPTPLPHLLETLRARSATPNQAFSNLEQSIEVLDELPLVPKQDEVEVERPEVTRRRSVVVEEEEDEEENDYLAQPRHPGPPVTPPQNFTSQPTALRAPHSSDAPSNASSESTTATGFGVPIFLSQRPMSRNDLFPSSFPSSPFTTPLKEKTISDDDEVLYPADSFRPRTPYATFGNEYEREISWIASPVPEIRMPIDDVDDDDEDNLQHDDLDDEQDYDDAPLSATSSHNFSPLEDVSPRASSDSKSLFIESETSPNLPPSPSSVAALSQSLSIIPISDDSTSPQIYPARLSIASRIQSERSPVNAEFTEWEDRIPNESLKRNGEASSPSTWEKVKNTFARAGPSGGRRSRSNSIVTRERRDYTDSSISRESGASLTSARTDRGDSVGTFTQQQQQQAHQPLMQSPSASASILSLPTHAPPRGSASPIPPPSSSDLLKYQDAKLFPFPGMKKLEEQRRAKGFPAASSSTPDVTMLSNGSDETQSHFSTTLETPDTTRERKLSHQASDTRLLAKYMVDQSISAAASMANQDNIDNGALSAPSSGGAGTLNLKLPMTLPGVKQWLSKNNKKKNVIPQSPSSAISIIHPVIDAQQAPNNKKPSLSDLLRRKDSELGTDWEDIGGAISTSASGDTLLDRGQNSSESSEQWRLISTALDVGHSEQTDSQKTPKSKQANSSGHAVAVESFHLSFDDSPSNEPRSDPLLSATPDLSSSLSDYPAHSTSESSSTSSSQYSLGILGAKGSIVLERLEENLARGSRSPMWAAAIDDPPRKLILSSPVLQVVNPHTVKDRFLFLFNDILIIAKPVIQDQDLLDTYKPMPLDRKYVVKSVVHVRDLHLGPDRTEPQAKTTNHGTASRNPLVKTFIHQFVKDPDHAITNFFSKSNTSEDPILLGQLLFKSLELDRGRLGEYFSQRTSKSVLKTYLDCFGFAGLRVDKGLRAFLFSLNVPPRVPGALEYLLDSFASRWYEANARIVAYDKDMAIRLVRALVQLNEFLHDGITHEVGSNGIAKRSVESKVFVDAFRRYDVRYLVSDELLEELYDSILHERLCQARRTFGGSTDVPITIKRPLPPRLTYKVQSDPIILRIPQADPQLSVQLYGQDLVFEPPILNFGKSSEVSFRVMGTSLGVKTMIMCRSGPNALKYSGLPLSTTLNVERAFMRNTFQVAFLNHAGMKRRYMFSVDDSLLRHQWAVFLKRHIDNSAASSTPGSPGASRFYKSAEKIAFKVLQETLIGSAVQPSLHRPSLSTQNGLSNSFFGDRSGFSRPTQTTSMHIRSKSRSRVYHRGAGRNELDLSQDKAGSDEGEDNDANDDSVFYKPEQGPRVDGLIWSGRDLEVQCLQNSSIPLVLSFLQIGAPELGQTLTS